MKIEIGRYAPDISAVDIHGDTVPLSTLWKDHAVLLFFHRHLGCIFAQQAFKRLDCSAGQLESHGIRVISIVPTTPANANEFCARGDYWHTCLADPRLVCYKSFGIPKANLLQMFGVKPMKSAYKAMKRGYRQSPWIVGNATVMPSAVVVDTSGIVRAVRYCQHIGDLPTVSQLKSLVDHSDVKHLSVSKLSNKTQQTGMDVCQTSLEMGYISE